MAATAVAALAGLPAGIPPRVRDLAFLLLGISIGSSATPESVAQMAAWPGSLLLLAISVVTTLTVTAVYLERVHRWDRTTARFSAMPGAFSTVVVLAAASTADLPRVVLAQSIRIFTLVGLMPPILALVGNGAGTTSAALAPVTLGPLASLLVIAAGGLLATAATRLGVPAGVLIGAMVSSAVLHATGLVEGRLPQPLVIGGFVATGAVIGARFVGTTLDAVRRTVPGAVASVMLALSISAAIAAFGRMILDLPFGQLWLAYAPGGVEAMAAMALALGLDPAFVGAHHVLRILGLTLLNPFWFRFGPRQPPE